MAEWKPDTEFLEFLLNQFEVELAFDVDKPLLGMPDGMKKGGEGYTMRDIVEKMREGEEKHWQGMYDAVYKNFQQDFKKYKINKQ